MTYGNVAEYPTKIGISRNVAKRIDQLYGAFGGLCLDLRAEFPVLSYSVARHFEAAAIKTFPRYTKYEGCTEIVAAPVDDVIEFIQGLGLVGVIHRGILKATIARRARWHQ